VPLGGNLTYCNMFEADAGILLKLVDRPYATAERPMHGPEALGVWVKTWHSGLGCYGARVLRREDTSGALLLTLLGNAA
jgi:hypothetical protein